MDSSCSKQQQQVNISHPQSSISSMHQLFYEQTLPVRQFMVVNKSLSHPSSSLPQSASSISERQKGNLGLKILQKTKHWKNSSR